MTDLMIDGVRVGTLDPDNLRWKGVTEEYTEALNHETRLILEEMSPADGDPMVVMVRKVAETFVADVVNPPKSKSVEGRIY